MLFDYQPAINITFHEMIRSLSFSQKYGRRTNKWQQYILSQGTRSDVFHKGFRERSVLFTPASNFTPTGIYGMVVTKVRNMLRVAL